MNANKQDAGGLPELPEPVLDVRTHEFADASPVIRERMPADPYYTADQMRAYGELCRAAPAGMVLVPREIVANYRESTHIPRHRRICDSALAAPAGGDVCATCQGHGMIGWTTGQTPEQFDQHEAPCPDCSAPAGSGEVEALASRLVSMSNGLHSAHLCTDLRRAAALLRKLQQGAE